MRPVSRRATSSQAPLVAALLLTAGAALLLAPLSSLLSPSISVAPARLHSSAATPTYVILVHGYDPSTTPATSVWTYGVDLYQQLVNAGYVVGIVSYYGTFTITFSNGTTLSDASYYGTTAMPIESVALELGKMLERAFAHQTATVDFVGHSMGGLVTEYLLEHVALHGLTVQNVIFLGSPLNGAPVTYLTPWLNLSGYEAAEMAQGSAFLTSLHAFVPNARANNPGTEWLVYVGWANPYWAMAYFSGHANDGFVDAPSAESIEHDHSYLFPDLHIPQLDVYTPGKVSYFEDPNFASEVLSNFSGHY